MANPKSKTTNSPRGVGIEDLRHCKPLTFHKSLFQSLALRVCHRSSHGYLLIFLTFRLNYLFFLSLNYIFSLFDSCLVQANKHLRFKLLRCVKDPYGPILVFNESQVPMGKENPLVHTQKDLNYKHTDGVTLLELIISAKINNHLPLESTYSRKRKEEDSKEICIETYS